jgi:hypothetical protein
MVGQFFDGRGTEDGERPMDVFEALNQVEVEAHAAGAPRAALLVNRMHLALPSDETLEQVEERSVPVPSQTNLQGVSGWINVFTPAPGERFVDTALRACREARENNQLTFALLGQKNEHIIFAHPYHMMIEGSPNRPIVDGRRPDPNFHDDLNARSLDLARWARDNQMPVAGLVQLGPEVRLLLAMPGNGPARVREQYVVVPSDLDLTRDLEQGINVMVVRENVHPTGVAKWITDLATTTKRPTFAIDGNRVFFLHPHMEAGAWRFIGPGPTAGG